MGMIEAILNTLFGGGRNALRETIEVFQVNAEAEAGRNAGRHGSAMQQFAQEFRPDERGRFDRFMDGVNRLPRPALALGTLGLFVAAMVDPVWFAARMAGISLVPEPLWWLLGVIVSFYFGARHQAKGQAFQRDLVQTVAMAPTVARTVQALEEGGAVPDANPALADWRREGATM
ncbi:holin family protein [Pseudoprimorskyibacter insulae]|uniref:Carboxylesterase n=1 Tax=Pseudoprimorskyibacter insulae TaxID=1695997 RepID=A0A2R8AXI8_9RHOB|nr:holin family protein [Pseudoprimorskyibacter insulae]SPF80742.1 hypothetical protein PRI8871_02553 [Pseudoprimorskyibacter insulae]